MKVLCLDSSGQSAVFELLDGVRTFVSGDPTLVSESYGVQLLPSDPAFDWCKTAEVTEVEDNHTIVSDHKVLMVGTIGHIDSGITFIDKLYTQTLQDVLKEYSCLFVGMEPRPVPMYPVQKQTLRRSPPSRNTGNPFKKNLRSVNRNR